MPILPTMIEQLSLETIHRLQRVLSADGSIHREVSWPFSNRRKPLYWDSDTLRTFTSLQFHCNSCQLRIWVPLASRGWQVGLCIRTYPLQTFPSCKCIIWYLYPGTLVTPITSHTGESIPNELDSVDHQVKRVAAPVVVFSTLLGIGVAGTAGTGTSALDLQSTRWTNWETAASQSSH